MSMVPLGHRVIEVSMVTSLWALIGFEEVEHLISRTGCDNGPTDYSQTLVM